MVLTIKSKRGRLLLVYLPIFLLILATFVFADITGPRSFHIAVQTGNTAPIVYNVTPVTVTLSESALTTVAIEFNVTDADGVGNLNSATAAVNVSMNPLDSYARINNSQNCAIVTNSFNGGLDRTYRCNVTFFYYDNSSNIWFINASIQDGASALGFNSSQVATLSSLSAFQVDQSTVFLSSSLGTTNNEVPFTLNNTGNFNFTEINITGFDLNASLTDFFFLNGNFSINATQSGPGFGINLANWSGVNLSSEHRENLSITLGPANITGGDNNDTIFIYIDIPSDAGLSSGVTYNSSYTWDVWAR